MVQNRQDNENENGCGEHTAHDNPGEWLLAWEPIPVATAAGSRPTAAPNQDGAHLLFGAFSNCFFQCNSPFLKFGKTGDKQDSV